MTQHTVLFPGTTFFRVADSPVLEAGSHWVVRAHDGHVVPTLGSVTSSWVLEIGRDGSVYTKEIGKYYKSGPLPALPSFISWLSHIYW